jgi:16S rRNA (guanine(527)-N(7))-methyltransferase RsmG
VSEIMNDRRKQFASALERNMADFDVSLDTSSQVKLGDYFALLEHWNGRLHLVAPCSPEEFATRHVLESLVLLRHLAPDATVVDVGSGAGLPLIPCLVALPNLEGTLIESSQKKSVFLREALNRLDSAGRARVVSKRFEEVDPGNVEFVTCRALEQLTSQIPTLLAWANNAKTLLLFGGTSLGEALQLANCKFEQSLIPHSTQRFLFIVSRLQEESQ